LSLYCKDILFFFLQLRYIKWDSYNLKISDDIADGIAEMLQSSHYF